VDDRGALAAADLIEAARTESAWLAAHGVRCAGLLADNGRGWAIADLALLGAGIPAVPLPHHFSAGQLRHALLGAGADALLTDRPQLFLDLDAGLRPAGHSPASGLALLQRDGPGPDACPLPPGTAKVTYTSGSTAEPKGVCLAAATLEAVAGSVTSVASQLRIRRHLSLLPLATLLENVAGLYASWLAGATCHLPSAAPGAIAQGTLVPAALLAEISRHQPESLILVPELLRILVGGAEAGWKAPAAGKYFAVGGARVSPELLQRAAASDLPVFEGYGLSECGSVVCLNTPDARRRGSVGRPLPHAAVTVDPQGEIHVGGQNMLGYVGATPLAPGAAIATGDLGEIDADGFVHVRGRIKNLFINSLGRNLSPEWIESELGQERAIGQVVVFGEARPRVVALITPAGPGVSAGAVSASVERANARLPAYARVAGYQLITERFSLANGLLTGNGRPRRENILQRYAAQIDSLYEEPEHVIL